MGEKTYVVDGSGYIFRAYYAVPPLTTKSGFPTNALFGFTKMLLKLLTEKDAHHVIVVFDAGAKTFRNEMYAEYKANRKECPQDLVEQMPLFRTIVTALGIPVLEQRGFEADDIIGTLTTKLARSGHEMVVVSADKDLMQLVNDHVLMWDTMRDRRFDRNGVIEKFGVPPEKVVEVLGLMGDDSDNVPGLQGCGPKTATQLIERYGDVETVLNSADKIREDSEIRNRKKLAELIESQRDTVRLSRKLVQVETEAPIEVLVDGKLQLVSNVTPEALIEALTRKAPDADLLRSLGERLEFAALFEGISVGAARAKEEKEDYRVRVVYEDTFDAFIGELQKTKSFAFDTETTSLDTLAAELIGASFCFSNDEAIYIPLGHTPEAISEGKSQVELSRFLKAIKTILEDPSVQKIGQNLKYDIGVFARHGVEVRGVAFDTMVAAYVLNPDQSSYNLTVLANDHLKKTVIEYDEVVGEKPSLAHITIDSVARYAGQDAYLAWMLEGVLRPRIESEGLTKVFSEIEMPLVPVLSIMEQKGVKLDTELLAKMSVEIGGKLLELHNTIVTLAGGEFNLNSPKQLSEVLFTKLGISTKGLKKTKTGISTDSSVLEKLQREHPIAEVILLYRMLHKLKSTYIDALPSQVSTIDCRLHSRFNQTVTGTGRLSSSDPNLQNIPITTAEGRKIRGAFIAEEGSLLISADYSQIELRVLAHMCGDENLIAAFHSDSDIHSRTAREIHGLAPDVEITEQQRREGKTINFGVIYGMGAFRLSKDLGISMSVAQTYIDNYFARYPGVKKFFAQVESDVTTKGFVTTLFGRKRVIGSIDTAGRDQGFMLRAAMNAPIQGTAADIIKIAMNRVATRLKRAKAPAAMIMQIHDELVFECVDEAREIVVDLIQEEMEGVAPLKVPLKVDIGWGKNWEEAKS